MAAFSAAAARTTVADMTAHPTLAEAARGGIVESAQRGAAAVVDAEDARHSAVDGIDSACRACMPLTPTHENTR